MSAAIGAAAFAALVWGAVLLVAVVFGYVAWSLLRDRGDADGPRRAGE